MPVAISTKARETEGIKRAYLQVSKTQGEGDMIFTVQDEEGHYQSILNNGEYGRPGFELSADYHSTKDWSVKFSKIGSYTFSYRLIDSESGDVLAEDEESVEVVPAYQNLGIQVYNNYVMRAVFERKRTRCRLYGSGRRSGPARCRRYSDRGDDTGDRSAGATGAWGWP